MPMYMDIHEIHGATAEDVAKAHLADVETQSRYGVEYHKYWFNESRGKIFCLCSAPSADAAAKVHREAHGLAASKIIEVAPEIAEGFLGGSEVNSAGAAIVPGGMQNDRDPGIRTIVFTDIVGSTELTQRVGDEAAMAFLKLHDTVVRDALGALGGREVKHTGDGIMAAFDDVAHAVRAAADIQRHFFAYNRCAAESLSVRIGIHAGEPVLHHNDLFGATVQLASRLCCEAEAAGIVVSGFVRELCDVDAAYFVALGERRLKGFSEGVPVFRLEWRELNSSCGT